MTEKGIGPACTKCGCTTVYRDFDESPTWLRITYKCGAEFVVFSELSGGNFRQVSKCRHGIWRARFKRFVGELMPTKDELGAFGVRLIAAGVFWKISPSLPESVWPLPAWINPQQIMRVGAHFMLFLGVMSLIGRAEKVINGKIRLTITRCYCFVTGRSGASVTPAE